MIVKIYHIYLVLNLFVISKGFVCNSEIKNINNCNLYYSHGYEIIPGNSYQCGCKNGCASIIDGCYNNTVTEPKINVYYPIQCKDVDALMSNSICNELYCPIGCLYIDKQCVPSMPGIICHSKIGWQCPKGCSYNVHTNICVPNSANDVCDLIKETFVCPFGCKYNYYIQKCTSSDPNYACELKKNIICPLGCKLNIRGDICIPDYMFPYSYAIQPYVGYYCSDGCTYDKHTNSCVSDTVYNICTLIKGYVCPEGLLYGGGGCYLKNRGDIVCELVNEPNHNTLCVYDQKSNLYKRKICEPVESRTCGSTWPYNLFTNTNDMIGSFEITYLYIDRQKYKDFKCKYSRYGDCENTRNTTQCSPN